MRLDVVDLLLDSCICANAATNSTPARFAERGKYSCDQSSIVSDRKSLDASITHQFALCNSSSLMREMR